MRFDSIKFKAVVLLALALTIPVIVVGSASYFYYKDVIRQNIWDNNLAQAKSISKLTDTYVEMGTTYLTSISDRPLVIQALYDKNKSFIDSTTEYTVNNSRQFDVAFITDTSGNILSYYPYSNVTGSVINEPYIINPINTDKPFVGDGVRNTITGKPTIYIGIPIDDANGKVLGVLVGGLNLDDYSNDVIGTQVTNAQYVYLVNSTGHVVFHNNKSYMNNMTDFSSIPSVQKVLNGTEGIDEQYFPFEHDERLAAFSPVVDHGWGVVVSLPVDVAYKPINDSAWWFVGFIILLLLLSIILAIVIGGYIANPLIRISDATKEIPGGDIRKYLGVIPLKRKDEIGELARSVVSMDGTIKEDRENILKAKNDAEREKAHAEEEKSRSDFYVDVMGHDINNLNQAIRGYLELLQSDKNLTDEQRMLVDNAMASTLGSSSIIENVRKVQDITSEKQPLEKLDIDSMISQCIKEVNKPSDKKIVINYSAKEGRFVKAIPLLKEVFCNLMDNSIKYSSPEVTIDISVNESVSEGKKFYDISVSDNGNGIPDSIKQKIFRRLQRGTTKAHGKGLGLYIVRTLVERLGGSVTVEDRVPGDYTKGSKFIVKLLAYEG